MQQLEEGLYAGTVQNQGLGQTPKGKEFIELVFKIDSFENADGVLEPLEKPIRRTLSLWATTDNAFDSTVAQLLTLGFLEEDISKLDLDGPEPVDLRGRAATLRLRWEDYNDKPQERWFITTKKPQLEAAEKARLLKNMATPFQRAMAKAKAEKGLNKAPEPTASDLQEALKSGGKKSRKAS